MANILWLYASNFVENLHLENKIFFCLKKICVFLCERNPWYFFVKASFVHSLLVEVSVPQAAQAMRVFFFAFHTTTRDAPTWGTWFRTIYLGRERRRRRRKQSSQRYFNPLPLDQETYDLLLCCCAWIRTVEKNVRFSSTGVGETHPVPSSPETELHLRRFRIRQRRGQQELGQSLVGAERGSIF